jgi:ferredoxin
MIRQIIKINEDKCNGCGLCAEACHEGAIKMINGKAKLIRDDYCDGLGNCLPVCPTGAISFEEREALPFDEDAVKKVTEKEPLQTQFHGCPGTRSQAINQNSFENTRKEEETSEYTNISSKLNQWPVQIKLVPVNAPYFDGANLLIAADCTAFSYGDFHNKFMKNRITLIGCPKLDEGDYSEKITAILKNNNIKSVTVVKMEVPCCTGIQNAVINALKNCGKMIPWQIHTITIDGNIQE